MRQRKLQIFLSSTYEDLIEHRLAAMEAILKAGHIPAAMEQFSPGDETAWERIRRWIDESDGFVLILGGRYGSIEPRSGKSYVQLEYEYAKDRKKPFFALVVREQHHEDRVKQFGLAVDERAHPDEYRRFRGVVTERLCGFWEDVKDIQLAIVQKLPEWAQDPSLTGWVRGDERPSAEAMNELAVLSRENRVLRSQLAAQGESYDGLSFDESVKLLRDTPVKTFPSEDELRDSMVNASRVVAGVYERISDTIRARPANAGELFDELHDIFATGSLYLNSSREGSAQVERFLDLLVYRGLIAPHREGYWVQYQLTEMGRRFTNRMLMAGSREDRQRTLWSGAQAAGN